MVRIVKVESLKLVRGVLQIRSRIPSKIDIPVQPSNAVGEVSPLFAASKYFFNLIFFVSGNIDWWRLLLILAIKRVSSC